MEDNIPKFDLPVDFIVGNSITGEILNQYGRFPAYENTGVCYFPLGDDMFPVLLEELKKAEHFIFMEYFIVEHGVMWDAILQVLETKAAEGVEVFVNGVSAGIQIAAPYRYDLSGLVKEGENELRIEVATTLEREMSQHPDPMMAMMGVKSVPTSESGITGMVCIEK